MRREELSASDLIGRVNAELAQYRAADGCRLRAVRKVGFRRDSVCNWTPSDVEAPRGCSRYLPVFARVIRDFQGRYDVADDRTTGYRASVIPRQVADIR